ncbi:MAG: hypothetical protein LBH98_09410 [Chitinispirillales bacterium]|jgi:hypothetical protein|nr:hypothetical protein [Chitinispirillales bacterium]
MIKMFCAHTKEIDDADVAVNDILSQIKADKNILRNSIGIISCCSEFAQTGVLKAICKTLPFTTVGTITLASGINAGNGQLVLSVSVITADDSFFVPLLSDKIDDKQENIVKFCQDSKKNIPENSKMILTFIPVNPNSSMTSETILNLIDDAEADIPIFGGAASSLDVKESAEVIFNGDVYNDRFVFVAVSGEINPKFVLSEIFPQKTVQERWIVTETHGNLIAKINGIDFRKFVENLGGSHSLLEKNSFDIVPFWFDFSGINKPVARTISMVTENGLGVCSGNVPIGVSVFIGNISKKMIVETTKTVSKEIYRHKEINGVLFFSGKERFFALGANYNNEMYMLEELLEKIPFHVVYSQGGYCSDFSKNKEGRFLNYSLLGFVF